MPELILASTSPARRALMDGLHLPYRCEAPGVNELVTPGLALREAVQELAQRKARAVHAKHPEAWVMGADQLAGVGGLTLGKPSNREAARKQLKLLLGRPHQIVTGVCLVGPDREVLDVEVAELTLYPLPDAELERYLDTGEWEGCAGGYRIEGRGQALMARIDGDRTNVQGLPMVPVVRMLRGAGFTFF